MAHGVPVNGPSYLSPGPTTFPITSSLVDLEEPMLEYDVEGEAVIWEESGAPERTVGSGKSPATGKGRSAIGWRRHMESGFYKRRLGSSEWGGTEEESIFSKVCMRQGYILLLLYSLNRN